MKRLLLIANLCVLLLPLPLGAQSACELGKAPSSVQAGGIASDMQAPEVALLFYELPEGLVLPPDQMITVDVRVDGAPYLVETVRVLPGQGAAGSVVELLSGDPARVSTLRAMAERGAKVELEISVGGSSTGIFRFEKLAAQSARLMDRLPLPRSVESKIRSNSARILPKDLVTASSTCEDLCWDERDWCYENRCDFGGPPSCLDACDNQFEDCLESCQPPPPCEPTSEIVYQSVPISYFSLGIDCFYDVYYPWDGWEFDEQLWTFKLIKKRITHNCDGTDTVEILSTSYYNDYCYQRWFWSCSGPFIWNRLSSCWY